MKYILVIFLTTTLLNAQSLLNEKKWDFSVGTSYNYKEKNNQNVDDKIGFLFEWTKGLYLIESTNTVLRVGCGTDIFINDNNNVYVNFIIEQKINNNNKISLSISENVQISNESANFKLGYAFRYTKFFYKKNKFNNSIVNIFCELKTIPRKNIIDEVTTSSVTMGLNIPF